MLKRYGTEYAGFYYPNDLPGLNENSIIYCVGAGEDISHDIEIAAQLKSKVYIFDPTPRAIAHVELVKNVLDGKSQPILNRNFGGGDPKYWDILMKNKIDTDKICFLDYGLHVTNDTLKFYKPSNPNYVSHSIIPGMKSNDFIYANVKNLKTIMRELDHDHIDFLKIDIEGAECAVIDQMLEKDKIFPTYLSIDFDLGFTGEFIRDMGKCNRTIEKLHAAGYQKLRVDHSNYSFYRSGI